MVELEHVAQILGTRKTEAAKHFRAHCVVVHRLTQGHGQSISHLLAGQVFTRNPDAFADVFRTFPEDSISALADVLSGHARQFPVAHRQREGELSVGVFFWTHAKIDQVIPVERCVQERRWHPQPGEDLVGLTLGIEVWNLVLAHQGGHPGVRQWYPLAGILKGGPNDMLETRGLRCCRHIADMRLLLLWRKVLPEEGHEVGAVRTLECSGQTCFVIDVSGDNLGA